jgi:hypothetical protein
MIRLRTAETGTAPLGIFTRAETIYAKVAEMAGRTVLRTAAGPSRLAWIVAGTVGTAITRCRSAHLALAIRHRFTNRVVPHRAGDNRRNARAGLAGTAGADRPIRFAALALALFLPLAGLAFLPGFRLRRTSDCASPKGQRQHGHKGGTSRAVDRISSCQSIEPRAVHVCLLIRLDEYRWPCEPIVLVVVESGMGRITHSRND